MAEPMKKKTAAAVAVTFSCSAEPSGPIGAGQVVTLRVHIENPGEYSYTWTVTPNEGDLQNANTHEATWNTYGVTPGEYSAKVIVSDESSPVGPIGECSVLINVVPGVKFSCSALPPGPISVDDVVTLRVVPADKVKYNYQWEVRDKDNNLVTKGHLLYDKEPEARWYTNDVLVGTYKAKVTVKNNDGPPILAIESISIDVVPAIVAPVHKVETVPVSSTVTMRRAAAEATEDLPLWVVIRKSTEALSFDNYYKFINRILCKEEEGTKFDNLKEMRYLPYNDVDAYRLLKVATEAFLMVNCGVAGQSLKDHQFVQEDVDDLLRRVSLSQPMDIDALNTLWENYLEFVNGTTDQTIPYLALIQAKLPDSSLKDSIFDTEMMIMPKDCVGIIRQKLTSPCLLELIWSYWQEEGMLVQTMNAINLRFQNIRAISGRDPLANLEIDPLRPLNNLLWGYIQDEQHRLSIARRAYEYDHQYGIPLIGKAVPQLRPVDSRSKFLEAFHNLLHLATIFYKEDDDTTVIADGFPLLHSLKDVHLLLSEGAHNQFGDLPSTARIEMLMQQWLLARREFREFLPTRSSVAYPELWMDRADAMKRLQGWTDVSVLHFRNLGLFGEQILLSVRYGHWSDANKPVQAANWARFWRAEIQGYIQAYRAVTGVDMASEIMDAREATQRYLPPSTHLRNRLAMQVQKVTR